MRHCVWSRNLKNQEAMARVGLQRHRGEKNKIKWKLQLNKFSRFFIKSSSINESLKINKAGYRLEARVRFPAVVDSFYYTTPQSPYKTAAKITVLCLQIRTFYFSLNDKQHANTKKEIVLNFAMKIIFLLRSCPTAWILVTFPMGFRTAAACLSRTKLQLKRSK